jgi:hypothetical protein
MARRGDTHGRLLRDVEVRPPAIDREKRAEPTRRASRRPSRRLILHVGPEDCGDNIAALYSLVATCEANGVC